MKKLLLIISIFCAGITTSAQNFIVCEDFNSYDSTSSSSGVFNDFTISYFGPNSYYTSTQSSGLSGPNSYKFGVDSATMVTPDVSGATYVQFWMKGNGTDSLSTFYVYDSPDGTNWTLIQAINPVNTSGMYRQYALNPNASRIQFLYSKSVGNVAFDDFCAADGPMTVGESPVAASPSVYPNPSNGNVTISASALFSNCKVTVMNLLGKEVRSVVYSDLNKVSKSFDLSDLDKGIYIIRCKSDKAEYTQRIILKD